MLISELGGVRRTGIGFGGLALCALTLGALISRPAAAQTLSPPPTDEPAPLATPPVPSAPPAPSPAPPPMNFGASMDLSQPAPPPLGQRTYHWHDGFYARVDGGLGTLLHTNISGTGGADVSASGLTLGYDLLLGGSIAPGFTLGGTLLGSLQLSGNWEASGRSVSTASLDTLIIGPFAEGYPNPEGGLHFGGALGLARAGLDLPGGIAAYGVGGAFWAGSDVWVAPDWSIGGLLRLDALYAKDNDAKVSSIGLTLMFSVLFN
jgi:hypothetical protein